MLTQLTWQQNITGSITIKTITFMYGHRSFLVLGRGAADITLSQLPTQSTIAWGMKSRKYENGMIVMLDTHNIPVEKIIFENDACIDLQIDYTQRGETYAATKLLIQAEKLIVGNDITFDSEWAY